jgi:hypothetical protein
MPTAAEIRAQYPGAYDKRSDAELEQAFNKPESTTASSGLWDTIKGYAKSAVESPSLMGAAGGMLGSLVGGAGAFPGAAIGAETAHLARNLDPSWRAENQGPESTGNIVGDVAKQTAISGTIPNTGKILGKTGQIMQSMPSAPPIRLGEYFLSSIPGYKAVRAASLAVPPAIRVLGRAAEMAGSGLEKWVGSMAAAASKGEPAGMADSLRNLYRSAGRTPPP